MSDEISLINTYEQCEIQEDVILNCLHYQIKQEIDEEIWFDVVELLNISVGIQYSSQTDLFTSIIQIYGNNDKEKFLLSLSSSEWEEMVHYLTYDFQTIPKKKFSNFNICFDIYMGERKLVFIHKSKKLFCTVGTLNNLIKLSPVIRARILTQLNFNEYFRLVVNTVKELSYLYGDSSLKFNTFMKSLQVVNNFNFANNSNGYFTMLECFHYCLSKFKKEFNEMVLYSYKFLQ